MQTLIEDMALRYRMYAFYLTVAVTIYHNLGTSSLETHAAPTVFVSLMCLLIAFIVTRTLKTMARIQLYCNLTLLEAVNIVWEVSSGPSICTAVAGSPVFSR